MEIRRCMKCMHALAAGETVCPACGRAYGSAKAEPFALKPGTILEGKYLVGEMLGQGGFGITYIGFDLLLEQKVAIKEYYPMSTGMVSRDGHSTVVWSSAMMGKTGAQKGFDSFLKEARKMAKLRSIPSVVGVNSVFIQNETAYIVMDFIEGETLLKKLQREGPMDFATCVSLMTPIMRALSEVHKHGIIHRDISPDNIMVQPDGTLILLDLGAAKDLDIQGKDGNMQSSQMVAKQGFSPIEQYWENGNVGPWTDVYAMAATIYYCCTGILPPSAVGRVMEDSLTCQPLLTQAQFDVLASCMGIMPQNRPQDMTTLLQLTTPEKPKAEPPMELPKTELSPRQAPPAAPPAPNPEPVKPPAPKAATPPIPKEEPPKPQTAQPKSAPKPRRPLPRWLLPTAAAVVVVLGIAIAIGGTKKPEPTVSAGNTAAKTAPVSGETHMMVKVSYDSSDRENDYFWGQEQYMRKDVKALSFQSSLENAPSSAWDVSEAGDRSVLAWMDDGNLYVAANGVIAPNPDASGMFAYFSHLRQIDFGECFDTSNVRNMSSMFSSCRSLTDLDLTGIDTSNVMSMDNIFSDCYSLVNLNLSDDFNTSSVTNMNGMFSRSNSLTSLDLSGLDTSNVIDMQGMFYGCSGLTKLNLSGCDASKVTSMKSMFSGCKSLADLNLTNFDTSGVTDMQQMFLDCSSLTNLDLSGINTSNVTGMDFMFSGCSSLTSLDLSAFDSSKVTSAHHMFSECSSLINLDVSGFDTSGIADMHNMFTGCSSLSRLDLSGFDTAEVTYMGQMFSGCSSLTNLDLSGFNTSNVTDMFQMFTGCNSLTSLNLSSFNTFKVTDMSGMFFSCSSLTSLDLSGFNASNVRSVYNMFSLCYKLKSLKCSDKQILEAYKNR